MEKSDKDVIKRKNINADISHEIDQDYSQKFEDGDGGGMTEQNSINNR